MLPVLSKCIRYFLFVGVVIVTACLACSKKDLNPTTVPEVPKHYSASTKVRYTSLCYIYAEASFDRIAPHLVDKGFVIGKQPNVTVQDAYRIYGWDSTESSKVLWNYLIYGEYEMGSTYYVRSYIRYVDSTVYGNEDSFVLRNTDPIQPPTLRIGNIDDLSAYATITNMGGSAVSDKGFVIGKTPNPTISNSFAKFSSGGTSGFCDSVYYTYCGFIDDGLYYYRPYAINASGVGYGDEKAYYYINPTLKRLSIKSGIKTDTLVGEYRVDYFIYSLSIKNDLVLPQGIKMFAVITDLAQPVSSNLGNFQVGDSIPISYNGNVSIGAGFNGHCSLKIKIAGTTTDSSYYCRYSKTTDYFGNTSKRETVNFTTQTTYGLCPTN